jgi:Sec-independent protein secretion pathway component TatC
MQNRILKWTPQTQVLIPAGTVLFALGGQLFFFAILPFASHFLLMQVSTITMFYWWLE